MEKTKTILRAVGLITHLYLSQQLSTTVFVSQCNLFFFLPVFAFVLVFVRLIRFNIWRKNCLHQLRHWMNCAFVTETDKVHYFIPNVFKFCNILCCLWCIVWDHVWCTLEYLYRGYHPLWTASIPKKNFLSLWIFLCSHLYTV